jgi:zinc ribbon protein
MAQHRQVSLGRKIAFYFGYVLMAVGILLFVSLFLVEFSMTPGRLGSLALRCLGGFAFLILGFSLRRIAIRGLAGSLLLLDPPRARDDLEPWSRAAGGLLDAALSEVKAVEDAVRRTEPAVAARRRCPRCESPNDADARYCKRCGAEL